MRKIKVAMLAPYPIHSKHNGVAMHTKKILEFLSHRADIELHLITFGNENTQFIKGGLNVHMIKKIKPLIGAFLIPQIMPLKRKINGIKPDLVHAQGSFVPYSTTAALLRNKYPTLLTVHGIAAKEIKFKKGINFIFNILFQKPNERYVVSKIPNIIAVSSQAKNVISEMTQSKIHVIPNGIDFEDIQKVQPHKSIEHPIILFIGNLEKLKDIDSLIKAIPIIKKSIPNIRVFIGGEGSEENKLKKLAKKLNIEENVKFLGFASGDYKYSWYKTADLCVIPSLYETFGIVCLEAMACGKPVVASNIGGIPFVVEDRETGLLFECGNAKDLAEKVIFLLQNEELREKMGEAGRKRAEEFTWDKIAGQTVEVYKEILQTKVGNEKFSGF